MEASAFRVHVGQLRLYENDQLMKVAEISRHPKFSEKLSAPRGYRHCSAETGHPSCAV